MKTRGGGFNINIVFAPAQIDDAEKIIEIIKAAFAEDIEMYGSQSLPMLAHLNVKRIQYAINNHIYYNILDGHLIIGGIHVVKQNCFRFYLDKLYLYPKYQNKGIGTKAMEFIERQYPQATLWTLHTSSQNRKNQYFYEKIGYQRVRESQVSDRLRLIEYQKIKSPDNHY
ncbi:MAG: GNAT family N-acetyltransferase [Syntrophomonadaceae bacterium]|jgi:GNAT superfamily N-acetyltransferase